jgi:MSHA biogenesis protein MshI
MSLFARKRAGWSAVCIYPDRIDLAQVKRNHGRPRVTTFHSCGHEGSAQAVLARLRKAHRLARSRCTTLLAPGAYQLFQVEAPAVAQGELRNALRWRVKDRLDYPVEQAALDAILIPMEGAPPARAPQAFAVSASLAAVAEHLKPFQLGKLPLEVVDIPELAQRNVAALLEDEDRGLALLAFDQTGGLLTFTFRGELYAFRRIDVSASQLVEADQTRRDALGERIALELQRSFDNFDRQWSFVSVSRLAVAEVAGAPWLLPCLASNSYVPVQRLDLSQAVDLDAVPELRDPVSHGTCLQLLGAALRPDEAGRAA